MDTCKAFLPVIVVVILRNMRSQENTIKQNLVFKRLNGYTRTRATKLSVEVTLTFYSER